MILLYLCVVICNFLHALPGNTTGPLADNIYSYNADPVDFISPFVLVKDVCSFCFIEWQTSYVQNASLYTTFLLFTRESGSNYSVVDIGDIQSLKDGGFNFTSDTKILIHGWLDDGTTFFAEDLREAYLLAEDVNVIAVSWPDMSQTMYPLSCCAITPVGQYTATFVDFLVTDVGISSNSIHVIGHSLGAHIAGVVGEYVTFGNLSRVTGLDPASPLISTSPHGRLDPSDADFVDVIHTTGDYLGIYDPCGHVDFYPNGGVIIQPGCGIDIGVCSHRRAYKYFLESVSSLGFISTACGSWSDYKARECRDNITTVMGEHVDFWARGNYYLYTNSESPFALWNSSLTVKSCSRLNNLNRHLNKE